eukprot:10459959-Karenia_brevis.AAC.1
MSSSVKAAISLGRLELFRLTLQRASQTQKVNHTRQWTSLAEKISGGITGGSRNFCYGCGKIS